MIDPAIINSNTLYDHIHYGFAHAKTIKDFKAVSMNVMHSSMEITDEFYSVLNESELQNRIRSLDRPNISDSDADSVHLFQEFLNWRKSRKINSE